MNTPVKRYVEIFEEKVENGKSVLRYYGYDHKMHTIGSGDVQALVDCMSDTVFPNGVPNFDGKERYSVTQTLNSKCTADNPALRTPKDEPYKVRLTAAEGKTFDNGSVSGTLILALTMGGTSIVSTAASFHGTYADIEVEKVTGNIVITVTESTH